MICSSGSCWCRRTLQAGSHENANPVSVRFWHESEGRKRVGGGDAGLQKMGYYMDRLVDIDEMRTRHPLPTHIFSCT